MRRVFVAFALLSLCTAAAVAEPDAPADATYLAFQIFTGSADTKVAIGGQPVLGAMPPVKALDVMAGNIIARIGATGDARRKLALVFGPISFDHSDAQAAALVRSAFDIAVARNVAVGFHLDDSIFWRARHDLIDDARNAERSAFNGPSSTGRRLDWGPSPQGRTANVHQCHRDRSRSAPARH